jgi:hypothetical protein
MDRMVWVGRLRLLRRYAPRSTWDNVEAISSTRATSPNTETIEII